MSEAWISVRGIEKHFAGVTALRGVSLSLKRGEIRCLAGENGSGKSTLIKILAGVYPPDRGEIWIDGQAVRRYRPLDAIQAGIQVIYQDFSLLPNLSVAENVALNTHLHQKRFWMNWRTTHEIAGNALQKLGVDIEPKKTVAEIPIAQRQLVAIAKALNQNARLIVMDEPTTALTRREIDTLFQIVKNLQRENISILFVSHKLSEIMEISETITILRDGELVVDGKIAEFDSARLTYCMTGRSLDTRCSVPKKTESTHPNALRVESLSHQGSFENVRFSLNAGEVLGITGLLGSGCNELAQALFGLQTIDSGHIERNGKSIAIQSPRDAIRHGIAYVPEDRLQDGLFAEQSIERNIAAPNLHRWSNRWGVIKYTQLRQATKKWLGEVNGKTESMRVIVTNLSGGNQQKVVLAKWLAAQTEILILNGPTVGIDIGAKMEIHEKIRNLAEERRAILLISGDLTELLQVCHRILLMHQGRIVDELNPAVLDESRLANRLKELT